MFRESEIERLARSLPSDVPTSAEHLPDKLCVFQDREIAVYYAPLGYTNVAATIAIVGLTPGWHQTEIAYRTAIEAMRGGMHPLDAHRMQKPGVAFAGSMRTNLVTMLDELGVHRHVGIPTSADLFGSKLLHTTSALRFPVFTNGKNYTGHRPPLTKHPFLVSMVDEILGPELAAVPNALVVPLGKAVDEAVAHLNSSGAIDRSRCLVEFPHPSGANAHRAKQFEQRKLMLKRQVEAWFREHPAA